MTNGHSDAMHVYDTALQKNIRPYMYIDVQIGNRKPGFPSGEIAIG